MEYLKKKSKEIDCMACNMLSGLNMFYVASTLRISREDNKTEKYVAK